MESDVQIIIPLLSAFAVGLLIGIERGWSGKHEAEGERVAGIRTFSMIGIFGGLSAILSNHIGEWVLGLTFLAVAGMTIAAYLVDTRRHEDIGTTTAYTKMVTFILAAWAAYGYYLPALGVAVIVVALLGMKSALHRWLQGMEPAEIHAGIKLLIISVVLLPLLPNQGFGPWEAINPRWIWWMVVLISTISFSGYFAIKYIGNRLGTLVTSITGGLASSTAVTLSMAQFARIQPAKLPFMAGVLFASSIMFIRVLVEVAVVNPRLLHPLWIPLTVMFLGLIASGYWLWRSQDESGEEAVIEIRNPLNILTAMKFGLFLGLVLFLSAGMQEWFGDSGIYALSLISGLMDVDAITLSLSRLAINDLSNEVAVLGILLATVMNTLAKGFMFAFFVGFRVSLRLIALMVLTAVLGLGTFLLIDF